MENEDRKEQENGKEEGSNYGELGLFELILENLKADYEKGKKMVVKNASLVFKKATKKALWLCKWFLISFVATLPILWYGIHAESKTVIVLAVAVRALLTYAFFILMSPLWLALEIALRGIRGSVKRFADLLNSIAMGEIVMGMVLAWLPLKNNLDSVFPFVVIAMAATYFGSKYVNKLLMTVIVWGLLALTMASFFVPYSMQAYALKFKRADQAKGMPIRIDRSMTCQGFRNGEYTFFGPRGECLKYYLQNEIIGEIELYKLTSKNRTHPISGKKLKPATKEIINALWDQICARERSIQDANGRIREKAEREEARRKKTRGEEKIRKAEQMKREVELARLQIELRKAEERQRKPYKFAICAGNGTSENEKMVSRKIAAQIPSFFDATALGYKAALYNADSVLIIEEVKFDESAPKGEFREIECKVSVGLKIVDSTGKTVRKFSLVRPSIAFSKSKARLAALEAAAGAVEMQLK